MLEGSARILDMRWNAVCVWLVVAACGTSGVDEGTTSSGEASSGTAPESEGGPSSEGDTSTGTSSATADTSGSETSSESGSSTCEIVGPDFGVPPTSTLEGMAVVPVGPGVRVEVPADWLDWHARHGNNLHLTREELELVRVGAGEWDTEYAEVLATLLDFDQCAAHVGSEGWGLEAVSFGDLQLRIYRVPETPEAIVELAMAQTWETLAAEVTVDDTGPWTRVRIGYDRFYGDYGGRANVDLHMHRFGDATAVLAGMFEGYGDNEELAAILASACWDSGTAECCGV